MNDQIKIGATIFGESTYHGLSINKVKRLTATQIVLDDGTKLRIPFNGHSTAIGSSGYGSTYYRSCTPELIAKYNRQTILRKISKVDFTKLETEKLNQILIIVNS